MLRNGHYNLKMIMDYQFKWLVKNRNPLSDAYKSTAILAAVRETGHPYYCSEGSVTEEACQIMLGYGVYTRQLMLPKAVVDTTMSSTAPEYTYVAYVGFYDRDTGKFSNQERQNLSKDLGQSR